MRLPFFKGLKNWRPLWPGRAHTYIESPVKPGKLCALRVFCELGRTGRTSRTRRTIAGKIGAPAGNRTRIAFMACLQLTILPREQKTPVNRPGPRTTPRPDCGAGHRFRSAAGRGAPRTRRSKVHEWRARQAVSCGGPPGSSRRDF